MGMHWQIEIFEELESTQTLLRQEALSSPEGRVVVARRQTAGYGRKGDPWCSEAGGLYVSWLLKPAQILPQLPWLMLCSVYSTLYACTGVTLQIKPPNDLHVASQKLAGMLIDAQVQGERPLYYVCGLGLNVNQQEFPPALRATSLYLQTGQTWSLEILLKRILLDFGRDYQALCLNPEGWRTSQYDQDLWTRISYNSKETIRLGALRDYA